MQDAELGEGAHIGVISPYKSQVLLIRSRLETLLPAVAAHIDVNTIDGFQGREKDVIIFSAVRSYTKGRARRIGFVADERRINVGLTRARSALLLVGQRHALACEPHWRAFIRLNADRGCALPPCVRHLPSVNAARAAARIATGGRTHQQLRVHLCRTLFDAKPKFNTFLNSVIAGTQPAVQLPAEQGASPAEDTELKFFAGADDDFEPALLIPSKRAAGGAAGGGGKRTKGGAG